MKTRSVLAALAFTTQAAMSLGQLPHAFGSECAQVDYQNRFGPIRDQDGHGYCWAFVGAGLSEEQFCLADSKNCGKSLSPLDSASCEPDFSAVYEGSVFGKPYKGSTITSSLNCALSQGICEESLAPYAQIVDYSQCYLRHFLTGKSCVPLAKLKALFLEACEKRPKQSCELGISDENHTEVASKISKIVNTLMPEEGLTENDIQEAALSSPDWQTFLKKILVPKQCILARKRIPGKRKVFTELYPQTYPDVVAQFYPKNGEALVEKPASSGLVSIGDRIIERLKKGSSLGIGICTENLDSRFSDPKRGPCAARHALIINASRWNPTRKQCEIHLRNSWGMEGGFNGWYLLSDVSKAVFLMDQIEQGN